MDAHSQRVIRSRTDSKPIRRRLYVLLIPASSLFITLFFYFASLESPSLGVHPTVDTRGSLSTSPQTRAYEDLRVAMLTRTMSSVADVLEKQSDFKFKEPAGQVGLDSAYGGVLREIAARREVQVILETGTWDGTGSSMALGQGLLDSDGVLFTIEAVEEQWIHAQRNLAPYPARCLLGVGVDTTNFPTIKAVERTAEVTKMNAQNEEWRNWLASEKALADLYPVGLIKPICERYPVHFVHIDGGEFSGTEEFKIVRRYCLDVKYIAMDDVNTFKNAFNYEMLKNDPMWQVYKENMEERNGWAIFRRLN